MQRRAHAAHLRLAIGLSLVAAACTHPPAPAPASTTGSAPGSATEADQQHALSPPYGGSDIAVPDSGSGQRKTWRFASFFMGVKSQVAQHWHPEEAYRRHNPAGTRSSPRINRSTELRVELTSDGGLRTLKLLGSCGLGFLDDEALSAVREAAPFAHPPRGLIDGDGLMRFKFGLLFDPSGGPSQMWWSRIRDDRTSVDAGAAD